MKTVNQTNYQPKDGLVIKGKSLTQLAEYQPLQKMLANLTIAGLNSSAKQALEFFDGNVNEEIDIPLLPRHIAPDIVSVHEAAMFFQQQKQKIEDRVREEREAHVEKLRAAQQTEQGTPRVSDPGPGEGQSPPGLKPGTIPTVR